MIFEDVEIHDFESVADYAQHIGETVLISRMPSKVEEMGIAALATGDEAVKEAYEFATEKWHNIHTIVRLHGWRNESCYIEINDAWRQSQTLHWHFDVQKNKPKCSTMNHAKKLR